MKHDIDIIDKNDYSLFFETYIVNNEIKEEYKEHSFVFNIISENNQIDPQILYDYYLISNRYAKQAYFYVNIHLTENTKNAEELYYSLSAYSLFQQMKRKQASVCYENNKEKNLSINAMKGFQRLLPLIDVNKDSLNFLRTGIDKETWNCIKAGKNGNLKIMQEVIYKLCWRLLLSNVEGGNKSLDELRKSLFCSDQFYELIEGCSLISLIIFAMMDYSFRRDAVKRYKAIIKEKTGERKTELKAEDFLVELQFEQKRSYFEASVEAAKENYDNKTIWLCRKKNEIHPFVVREMYEAVTISEGIIQLMENIVFHAGKGKDNGEGVLGIYVRNFEKNKYILEEKYPEYMDYCKKENLDSKYYIEILIADLSGTDIPQKFISNNTKFIMENESEFNKKVQALGGENVDLYKRSLESFFNPNKEESIFWNAYFSFPDKAINHYGLQIFDSIIDMKQGCFEVESGKETYCNRKITDRNNKFFYGTKYSIIWPFQGNGTVDSNIYDSMFGYDYSISANNERLQIVNGKDICKDIVIPVNMEEKQKYITYIAKELSKKKQKIVCVDVESFKAIECVAKAILLYIFRNKEKDLEQPILIALLNCQKYQIINLVRIFALFYDKQGENIRMKNVQIYIRGEKVGEEILFYGNNLKEVKSNIAKSACIRGTMFDNLQTVNIVLERSKGVENE